jgi:hypothetical protein
MEELRERMRQLETLKALVDREGRTATSAVIIGVRRPDGTMAGKMAPTPSNGTALSPDMAHRFRKADPETRTQWLAFLVDLMEKQGELK